jgi:hypothetical protein
MYSSQTKSVIGQLESGSSYSGPWLFCRKHTHLAPPESRQLGVIRWILGQKPPADGLPHGGTKNGVRVPNRAQTDQVRLIAGRPPGYRVGRSLLDSFHQVLARTYLRNRLS